MLTSTLMIVSPILIAAIGGMICERAGVVNIALEGLMSFGAMTAAITHVYLEHKTGFSIPLALFFAALSGGLFSLIHAFASVTLNADQVISGTGINLLANGLNVFICQLLFHMDRSLSYMHGIHLGFSGFIRLYGLRLLFWRLRGLCFTSTRAVCVFAPPVNIRKPLPPPG